MELRRVVLAAHCYQLMPKRELPKSTKGGFRCSTYAGKERQGWCDTVAALLLPATPPMQKFVLLPKSSHGRRESGGRHTLQQFGLPTGRMRERMCMPWEGQRGDSVVRAIGAHWLQWFALSGKERWDNAHAVPCITAPATQHRCPKSTCSCACRLGRDRERKIYE